MKCIDLNCDIGELPKAIADGTQEALMPSLTSINIACGGHAGDEQTMKATIMRALRWKLAIGAHPGYPDRQNFGRLELNLSPETIADFVFEQVRALAEVAAEYGTHTWRMSSRTVRFTIRRREIQRSPKQLRRVSPDGNATLCSVGLAGSAMLKSFSGSWLCSRSRSLRRPALRAGRNFAFAQT